MRIAPEWEHLCGIDTFLVSYSEVVSTPYLLHQLKDFYMPVKRQVMLYLDVVHPSVCPSVHLSVCSLTFRVFSISP